MFQGIDGSYWTGGHDVAMYEGDWKWLPSFMPVEGFVWYGSEPNSGLGYDCLFLYQSFGYKGADAPCENHYYPICQIKN